jgi:hypothetical protein
MITIRPPPRRRIAGSAADQEERAGEVHVDVPPPVLRLVIDERGHAHVGVVRDQHVDPAERLLDLGDHALHRVGIGDVGDRGYAAGFGDHRVDAGRRLPVVHRHARPLGGQPPRDRVAEALAGAADERELVLEAPLHQITAPAFGESVWPVK